MAVSFLRWWINDFFQEGLSPYGRTLTKIFWICQLGWDLTVDHFWISFAVARTEEAGSMEDKMGMEG